MPTQEQLVMAIPIVLLVALIVAAILTRGKNKIETQNETSEIKPPSIVDSTPAPSAPNIPSEDIVKAIHEAVREEFDTLRSQITQPSAPVDPNIDPMDIVHPVGTRTAGAMVTVPAEELTLIEKLQKAAWNFVPAIMAVLFTLYLLQGYVKIPSYAADSKGLNERISVTENISLPRINKTLAELITQINDIGANISTLSAKDQTFATSNLVVDANANIAKLQLDLRNVSGNLQTLQVTVAGLQKSHNVTSNVTGNTTK